MAQVKVLIAKANQTASYGFTRDLSLWSQGQDVLMLQTFLNDHGFVISPAGPGSPGYETMLFGYATFNALKRYQRSQALPATGYFGPLTRTSVKNLVVRYLNPAHLKGKFFENARKSWYSTEILVLPESWSLG